MDPQRVFIGNLVSALLLVLIAGLLVNRRYRLCRSFLAYALLVFTTDRLILGWPETFDRATFWYVKEGAFWVLKIAIAAEIGLLTFARLERARTILTVLVATLVIAGSTVQLVPIQAKPGDAIAWVNGVISPRGQTGILVLLAAVLVLAAFYRVPIHPFHRSIVLGFALYLFAYTGALTVLRELGAAGYRTFLYMDPTAYAATVGVWTWAAWRRAPVLSAGVRVLQPWATSSW
jgi:hypothetical protein